jgi:hypothetical protein
LRAQPPINPRVSLKHLVSKLLAGGLTAGIVLIWWPSHYPTSGLEWLTARGAVATLGFELMMLAFAGVEDRVLAQVRVPSARVARLRERAAMAPSRARTGFVLAAGGAALAIPVLALASAGAPHVQRAAAAAPVRVVQPVRTRVVRQVVVKRQVVHDEVVVTTPAAASTAAAPVAAPAKTTPSAVRHRAARPAPQHAPVSGPASPSATTTTPTTTAPTTPAVTPTTAPAAGPDPSSTAAPDPAATP